MNTMSETPSPAVRAASAVVTGARHLRSGRNGQDAVVTLVRGPVAVAVVCDGCSGGASSEVGARLGAALVARAVLARLERGEHPHDLELWAAVRLEVAATLRLLAEDDPEIGPVGAVVHDHFLFTIVAAAITPDAAAIWALGDGSYAIDGEPTTLGPFANNEPPYLAYDLLGEPRPAHLEIVPARATTIVIATDGVSDLATMDADLAAFASSRFFANPDALRRELVLLARADERIDWDERRIVRTPAPLQDDCAIAVLQRLR